MAENRKFPDIFSIQIIQSLSLKTKTKNVGADNSIHMHGRTDGKRNMLSAATFHLNLKKRTKNWPKLVKFIAQFSFNKTTG